MENQGQIEKYKKSEPRKVWIDENGAKAGPVDRGVATTRRRAP
jgi:hypothetical protein